MQSRFAPIVLLLLAFVTSRADAQRNRNRQRPDNESQPATQPEQRPGQGEPQQGPPPKDNLSVTDHEITVHGQQLKYKAIAGTLVLHDEANKPKANMFFVAYQKQPASEDLSKRPITFVFNGGPGAASVWLHLGTAGPKRVALDDLGAAPAPPYHLVDNQETWLESTDLVFIDPVGTGYSRPAPGERAEQFYGVEEDVRAVAEFIRLYVTRYERWTSPKFLAGESYGTTRAAALSQYLLDNGIGLNGIILVSSVLNFGTISMSNGNDLPYSMYLPSYTAIAWYHKKLPQDLQADLTKALKESEDYALHGYMTALATGSQLPDAERAAAVKKLARLTGLSAELIDRADLRVDPSLFRKQLLADKHQVIGRYDARIANYDTEPTSTRPDYDPSYTPFMDAYAALFNDYARRSLKFESDVQYEVLSSRVRPWNFGQGGNGYLDVADRLRNSMVQTPNLKVLFNSGLFDLATPYLAEKYTVNHLDLGTDLRKNISEMYYDAGHMVYHHRTDREKLNNAVAQFIQNAIPAADRPREAAKTE